MVDREKVKQGLENCISGKSCCDCPYEKAIDCIRYINVGDYDKVVPKSMAEDALALLKEQDETISSLQSTINKLNEATQNTANQKMPKETEIPPEAIEGLKRNEELLRRKINELYDELISAKRAEIERLKAEIAKMPPLDYEKLAENPPTYPVKFGIACGVEPTKENVDE